MSVNRDIIGSDNALSPIRRQAIIWTNDGLLPIGPYKKLLWNFNQNTRNFIHKNAFQNIYHLQNSGHFVQGKMS